jgi:hypothetical protein
MSQWTKVGYYGTRTECYDKGTAYMFEQSRVGAWWNDGDERGQRDPYANIPQCVEAANPVATADPQNGFAPY